MQLYSLSIQKYEPKVKWMQFYKCIISFTCFSVENKNKSFAQKGLVIGRRGKLTAPLPAAPQ